MKEKIVYPQTYSDAVEMGYKVVSESHCPGYIPRNLPEEEYPVRIGGGRRKGQLYVEFPDVGKPSTCVVRKYIALEDENAKNDK